MHLLLQKLAVRIQKYTVHSLFLIMLFCFVITLILFQAVLHDLKMDCFSPHVQWTGFSAKSFCLDKSVSGIPAKSAGDPPERKCGTRVTLNITDLKCFTFSDNKKKELE